MNDSQTQFVTALFCFMLLFGIVGLLMSIEPRNPRPKLPTLEEVCAMNNRVAYRQYIHVQSVELCRDAVTNQTFAPMRSYR